MGLLCRRARLTSAAQKNEGEWRYSLRESEDGASLLLLVAVGRYLDAELVAVDVQPALVRCLINGRLLQIHLLEVRLTRDGAAPCAHIAAPAASERGGEQERARKVHGRAVRHHAPHLPLAEACGGAG